LLSVLQGTQEREPPPRHLRQDLLPQHEDKKNYKLFDNNKHGFLVNLICSICGDKKGQQDLALSLVDFSYNSSKHRSTGRSLFSIVYTKVPTHVVGLVKLPSKGNSKSALSFADNYNELSLINGPT